jgi:hypothetical protein
MVITRLSYDHLLKQVKGIRKVKIRQRTYWHPEDIEAFKDRQDRERLEMRRLRSRIQQRRHKARKKLGLVGNGYTSPTLSDEDLKKLPKDYLLTTKRWTPEEGIPWEEWRRQRKKTRDAQWRTRNREKLKGVWRKYYPQQKLQRQRKSEERRRQREEHDNL